MFVMMTNLSRRGRGQEFCGFVSEFRQAVLATEKIGFAVVSVTSRGLCRLDVHTTNWISHIGSPMIVDIRSQGLATLCRPIQ
jgi:hypothetical protein